MILAKMSAKKDVACPEKATPKKSPFQEQLPVIGAASGLLTLVFAILFLVLVYGPQQSVLTHQLQGLGQQAVNQLQVALNGTRNQTRQLAQHPDILRALASSNEDQNQPLTQLEQQLQPALGPGRELQLFSTHINGETHQQAGFAALDLGRRILKGETPPPEAAKLNGSWKILSASPVSEGGTIIGAVLVTTPVTSFQQSLQTLAGHQGSLAVYQNDTASQPVLTTGPGEVPGADRWQGQVPGTSWKVVIQPSAMLREHSALPWWPVPIALLLSLGILAGTAHLIISRRRDSARPDIRLLEVLFRDLAAGRQPHPGGFQISAFQHLATLAIELFARKARPRTDTSASSTAKETAKKSTSEASPPQPSTIEVSEQPADMEPSSNTPILDNLDETALAELEPVASVDEETTAARQQPDDTAVDKSIFRAYDIRGIAGQSLNAFTVQQIGLAIGSEARTRGEHTIIVANDGRLSSPEIREQLVDGLLSAGCDVVTLGTVPTPVLYFATHELNHSSGVMITGSHNPADYNGFKIVLEGETLYGEQIQALYRRIDEQNYSTGTGQLSSVDILPRYQKRILDDVILSRPLKIVLDCGNGVAGTVAPDLFEQLGCDVIPLYCEVDGRFPNHHPDPGQPDNLRDLVARVQETNADLGLAFDGDGDRVGLVTNKGTIIYPDRLLMLLAKDVVSRNPGTDIIFDVKCTRRLNTLISSYGGRPVMCRSGHSLIKKKMQETGALLAGEMSGHIFYRERWYGFDDGLYSGARIVEVLTGEDDDVDTVFQAFPEAVSTPELTIAVEDERKFALVERLASVDYQDGNINTIDGVRVDYPWGWGLVRASNTGPMLTCRFEADDDAGLARVQDVFRQHLNQIAPGLALPF